MKIFNGIVSLLKYWGWMCYVISAWWLLLLFPSAGFVMVIVALLFFEAKEK